ncbi:MULTISPECIES: flagellar hook-length control protein FliK [unclassified Paenibacillus]|uniref:flagellar hook-length control protein FliK n=1 Tax=unclassified Paenibacillus TaxID=185978 RepID=UPI000953E47C|nr:MULTISPECIES: flagellar hook-length control protein FliK [unclassified Paenibacillus]ASS65714.1 flagellar hook-length control protein FliK [Paenibacillus sp. RUD330]SIQ26507.1 flagellar hook-length control protein FliK [Paenibacillus sp. RU4X]SIQ48432.1 flagellar hook-length control protein FliK [Paenibacillus sp. RU4T]
MEITTTQPTASTGSGASVQAAGGKAAGAVPFSQAMAGALQTGVQGQASSNAGNAPQDAVAAAAALAAAMALSAASAQPDGAEPSAPAQADGPLSEALPTGEAAPAATSSSEQAAEPLLAKLEDLLDLLYEGKEEDGSIPLEDWQQAASELGALLALLGIQPPPSAKLAGGGQQGQDEPAAVSATAAAKGEVGELLLALRQQLPDVLAKPSGKVDSQALAQAQLTKLQSLLEAPHTAKSAPGGTIPDGQPDGTSFAGIPASGTTLLAKLEASSAHIRAAVSSVAGSAQADEAVQPAMLMAEPNEQPSSAATLTAGNVQPGAAVPDSAEATVKVPVHRFAQEVAGLVLKKLDVSSSSGMTEARLTLTPENLGQVDVKLQIHNGQLTALFAADSPAAREAIENQLGQLRMSLQNQGFQVDRLDVSASSQLQTSLSFGQQSRGGGEQGGQSARNGSDRPEEQGMQEAEVVQSAIRELGYGRAINETA